MKILSFGSMNVDHVYRVRHTVRPGETIPTLDYRVFPGGKGLNQSIALARAGLEVWHAGRLGPQGLFLKELLEKNAVRTEYIQICQDPTGHAVIQVDENGQNSIFLFGGTNRSITPEQFREVLPDFGPGDVLVCQNEINGMEELTRAARERGLRIALNPSPMDEGMTADILRRADWIYVNETEAMALTGLNDPDPDALAEGLLRVWDGAEWILTLGSLGSRSIVLDLPVLRQGIFPVQAVDTTGAGDTFLGYHLAFSLAGAGRQQALRTASAAAALAVSRPGASSSIPEREEVLRWMKEREPLG